MMQRTYEMELASLSRALLVVDAEIVAIEEVIAGLKAQEGASPAQTGWDDQR